MSADSSLQAELLFSLDTPQPIATSPSESYLKGWFVPPESVTTWKIMVLVDGTEVPVYTGLPRPDVRRHFGVPAAEKSGFVVRLRTPGLGERISLAVELDGTVRKLIDNIRPPQPSSFPSDTGCHGEKASSYREWIFCCEPRLFPADVQTPHRSGAFSDRPTISLLVEFEECHPYFLSMFLRSLLAQAYPHWQLCIAGDFDAGSKSFQPLADMAAVDRRVTVLPAAPRRDDSQAFNTALKAAEGEWIAPVRLYDELHPFAFGEIAASLQGREADIVYSDEDGMDLFGQRCHPHFKPDFDGEHLLSIDYVGHLAAVRRSLAQRSGGFRSLPPGPREWDFLLRCVEQVQGDKVAHIAKPLYHARTQETLAEAGVKTASVQLDDLRQVIRDHVTRTGKQAVAEIGFPTSTIRLQYRNPEQVCLSIFLRDEDGVFQTAALTELVNKQRVEFYGVLNGLVHRLPQERDGSDSPLRPPTVTLAETAGDVFLFINHPIDLLNHFFLQELIAQALRPDCGLVTGLSVDLAGRFIHTGFMEDSEGRYIDPFAGSNSRSKALGRHVRVVRSVRAISGNFFAVRREYVEAAGGFTQLASMPQLVRSLVEHAHRRRLQILVTPYSIGSFDNPDRSPLWEAARLFHQAIACWNPNLSAFSDPYQVLRA